MEVRAGEIIGIAGVSGNGQTELVELLTGLRTCNSGTVNYLGKDITNFSAKKIRQLGIGHIPADRYKYGFAKVFRNNLNLILGYHYKYTQFLGLLKHGKINQVADDLIQKFNIQPPQKYAFTKSLSGGNQQKLVVAREFFQKPRLLIIAEPTRGVDIGSIEFIHNQIMKFKAQGTAILLVSAELEEVHSLSDRAYVFYEGKISGEIDLETFDKEHIGCLMAGAV